MVAPETVNRADPVLATLALRTSPSETSCAVKPPLALLATRHTLTTTRPLPPPPSPPEHATLLSEIHVDRSHAD
jgi:hypothetical protein